MSCSLNLFETKLGDDGVAPQRIDLKNYMNSTESSSLIIGRGSPAFPADIVLNARKDGREIISRNHAKLTYSKDNLWMIEDLGAVNGIFVNRKRILQAKLNDGDVLQLGGISNVPIGQLMKDSDLCIKYRFSNQAARGTTKKNKRERVAQKEIAENRPTKVKREMKEKGVLEDLDQAHAALNVVLSSKDAQIAELQSSLDSTEATKISLQSRVDDLDTQIKKQESVRKQLEKITEELQSTVQDLQNKSTDYQSRYREIKQRYDKVFVSQQQQKVKETLPSSCTVSISALEALLECPACEGILSDPIILSCSHAFCADCLPAATCTVCDQMVKSDSTNKGKTSSVHLNSLISLLAKTS